MPCYDHQAHEDRNRRLKRLDEITQLLCTFCRFVAVDGELPSDTPKEIKAWWEIHREFDKARGRIEIGKSEVVQ